MNIVEERAKAQAQSAADVKEVQELMKAKGIRVEARQRLNTENGFIELVAIFISEKRIDPAVAPAVAEEPVLVETKEAEVPHAEEAA